MDEKEKKVLNHSLKRLVKELNPQHLLPYLPCLTDTSKEEIEAEQRNSGKSLAVSGTFYGYIIRRPEGFKQLIDALRDPGINRADLADSLTASLEDVKEDDQTNDIYNVLSQEKAGWRRSTSSRDIRSRREVPNGAANWTSEFPKSSGQQGVSSSATEPLRIDTPWRKLPGRIETILRKFDIEDGLKRPTDLAGVFGFTVGEINELKARTPPKESLTLAIITCQAQWKQVILGDLFEAFYALDRIDILNELQETTGVKFGNQQVESDSLSNRRDDVNINCSTEKPLGCKKSVTNEKECEVSRQTAERLPQNYVCANQDSKHNIVDNCKWNVKDDVRSLKEVTTTDQGQKGQFIGYKPEEILNNMTDNRTSPLSILEEKPEKKEVRRELLSRLPSAQLNGDVLPMETQQEEGNEAFVNCENNLGRSNSSCSSNTDNNDSLNCQPDDLNADDSEKLELDNISVVETSGEKINMCKGNIGECNENVLNHGNKQLGSVLEPPNLVNSENYLPLTGSILTPNSTSEQLLDENSVKAEFDKMLLEENLKGDNLSNIWSQHSSVKGFLLSTKSRHDGSKQEEGKRTFFMSAENYVDHSLEDNKIEIPKLSICSQDMQSIERKAGKKLPGDEWLLEEKENDLNYSYPENSDGSFQIAWALSEGGETLSTDGEQERQGQEDLGLTKQSYGQYFVQSQDVESGKVRIMKDQEQVEDVTIFGNRNNELDVKELKDVKQENNSNVDSIDFERHDTDETNELKFIGIENSHVMFEGKASNDNMYRSRHGLFKDGKLESSDVERLENKNSERVSEGTEHIQDSIEEVSNENRLTVITHRKINCNENELQTGARPSSVKDLLKTCLNVIKIVYENSV